MAILQNEINDNLADSKSFKFKVEITRERPLIVTIKTFK